MKPVITAKNDHGFSIPEFMVVLWLLGILAAITASSFDISGWLGLYRLKGTARGLLIDLQKARMNAITEDRSWAIVFDTGQGLYRFQAKDGAGNWVDEGDPIYLTKGVLYGHGSATFDAGGGKTPFTSTNPAKAVSFVSSSEHSNLPTVTFNSRGLPSTMGGGYCYLANSSGAAFAVGVNTAGVIKMRKWSGSDWQ